MGFIPFRLIDEIPITEDESGLGSFPVFASAHSDSPFFGFSNEKRRPRTLASSKSPLGLLGVVNLSPPASQLILG